MSSSGVMEQIQARSTWAEVLEVLRNGTEEECWELLEKEKSTHRRIPFMMRIFGRANDMRAERERSELLSIAGAKTAAPPLKSIGPARSPKQVQVQAPPPKKVAKRGR